MSTLKVVVSSGKAVLSGHLDEHSDLSPLKGGEAVVMNFKEVDRVNSCGVKEWVNLLGALDSSKVTYEECPMVVVKQLNAVPDFQGKAKVSTFQAPYFCEECDEEAVKLLNVADVKGDAAPEMKCEKCSKPLNFDAIANQYFSFIKRAA